MEIYDLPIIFAKEHFADKGVWNGGLRHLKNLILDEIRGVPDAIVVGEHHYNMSHAHVIEWLIKRHEPEYVLMEAFNDKTPEELEDLVHHYKLRTLEDLCKQQMVPLESIGIGEEVIREIHMKIGAELRKEPEFCKKKSKKPEKDAFEFVKMVLLNGGHIPTNLEELTRTPLYILHPKVLDVVHEKVRDAWLNRKMVAGVKAIEIARHVRAYKRTGSAEDVLRKVRYDVIMSAVADVDAKVAGCDINKSDPTKILPVGLLDNIDGLVAKIVSSNRHPIEHMVDNVESDKRLLEKAPEIRKFFNRLGQIREQTMYEKILEYSGKRSSNAPIIAIVGRAHIDGIHERLKKTGLKHKTIKLPSVRHI